MFGDALYLAHVAFQAVTRPFRERRALAASKALSDAKDAYRAAKVRGDTRAQAAAEVAVLRARTAQLRAELALNTFASHPRER
jgi:HAMP domain-containing protein